ncbi:hypothetical protein [Terrarubrum flagellatum]|uniref:hypothetical protein n=1 Tax=Terrirubrum flagellatum TaxID=2895980 RepID=UPI00314502A7
MEFPIGEQLENAYADFMRQTQHPRTGYWGPWYRMGGKLFIVQDLSFTFHHVNYRAGNVENWNRLAETTLRIRDKIYPNGWRPDESTSFSNHHNYDVVQIFFRGWPYMSQDLKKQARAAMLDMLRWCLTESVEGDGFGDDDPFEAMYFGVRFLDRIGYWDDGKRFWSREPLPTLEQRRTPLALAKALLGRLRQLGAWSERGETLLTILEMAVWLGERAVAEPQV